MRTFKAALNPRSRFRGIARDAAANSGEKLKNFLPLFAALLSGLMALGGVYLGSQMTNAASLEREYAKASLEYKLRIYQDFLAAQASLQKAQGEAALAKANLEIRNATLRMAVFSDKKVVSGVAIWLRDTGLAACSSTGENGRGSLHNDLSIYHSMRREAFLAQPDQNVSDEEFANLILGCALNVSKGP